MFFLFQIFKATLLNIFPVVIFLIFFSIIKKEKSFLLSLISLFGFIFLELLLLNLFRGKHFFHLHYNWIGKILESLWPIVFVFVFKIFTSKEVGYQLPKEKFSWVISFIISIIFCLIIIFIDKFTNNRPAPINIETLLFQLTMPGIAEEPVYRGILPAFFDRYFKKSWTILKAKLSLGSLFSTILFTMAHVVQINSKTHEIDYFFYPILSVTIVGLILAWIRNRFKSLWPCVFLHNSLNASYFLISSF